jgi:hypothetical protein
MRIYSRSFIILALATLFSSAAFSQKVFTAGDYKQADSLVDLFNKKVFNTVQKVNWVEGKPVFWYSIFTTTGKEFWMVNAEKLSKEKIFITDSLVRQLSELLQKPVKNEEFSPVNPKLSANDTTFTFQMDTLLFEWNRVKNELRKTGTKPLDKPEGYWGERAEDHSGPPVKSPNGKWIAFIRENNVFVNNSVLND